MWECAAVRDERSCVLLTSLTGTVVILAGASTQFWDGRDKCEGAGTSVGCVVGGVGGGCSWARLVWACLEALKFWGEGLPGDSRRHS